MSTIRTAVRRVGSSAASFCTFRRGSAGVVRIVKPPKSVKSESVQPVQNTPLTTESRGDGTSPERFGAEVLVADLFRQYQNKSSKSLLLSVIGSLSSMKLQSTVLEQFPGFVQMIEDATSHLSSGELTVEEVSRLCSGLAALKFKPRENSTSIDFDGLAGAFSDQIVALLDSAPMIELVKLVVQVETQLHLPLDSYFYWALNKEMTRWLTDSSVSDEDFILNGLGALQALIRGPLAARMQSTLQTSAIEDRAISLIETGKLNNLQNMELVLNARGYFPRLTDTAIRSVLKSYKAKLEESLADVSVLVSAMSQNPVLRNSDVVSELSELLLSHTVKLLASAQPAEADVVSVAESVSFLLLSGAESEAQKKLLENSAKLILANPQVSTQLSPNTAADLFYVFASATAHEENASYRAVCHQIESVVVGSLPRVAPPQLARLSLSFASGLINHVNSFKALGATVRNKSQSFSPSDFTDAIYGLAFRGILAKSVLVSADMDSIARGIPTSLIPKFAWALAVADYSLPLLWELLLSRIDKEILRVPTVLNSLSRTDSAMLYEVLAAARLGGFGTLSKMAMQRMQKFQSSWTPSVEASEIDYAPLLDRVKIPYKLDVQGGNPELKLAIAMLPVFLPEYKLVLDTTKHAVTESGLTNGSVKIRHSAMSRMGYNVISIPDTQYAECAPEDLDARAAVLGSIINQFIVEVDSVKVKNPANLKRGGRESGLWSQTREAKDTNASSHVWGDRDDSVQPPRRALSREGWSSRIE